jgi:hypothetical protein
MSLTLYSLVFTQAIKHSIVASEYFPEGKILGPINWPTLSLCKQRRIKQRTPYCFALLGLDLSLRNVGDRDWMKHFVIFFLTT